MKELEYHQAGKEMKTYLLISFFTTSLFWLNHNQQDRNEALELNITRAEWYTSISDKGFGEVYLRIEGNSNGELVTIETAGDGITGCEEVQLDENHNFFTRNYGFIPASF
jgi:hypothetical protein